ncbi:MAG: hypothetical protein JRJ59_03060 [Deltaproteobacteria bacterium]|nr:hypothetical protein [Deltaproteobacteria bacterium]
MRKRVFFILSVLLILFALAPAEASQTVSIMTTTGGPFLVEIDDGTIISITLDGVELLGGSFAGEWDTNWGYMVLYQSGNRVWGSYTHDDGRIEGTVSDNVFTGTWSEAPSYSPPDDAGDCVFRLSEDGNSFEGDWRYGSSEDWSYGGWRGTRY